MVTIFQFSVLLSGASAEERTMKTLSPVSVMRDSLPCIIRPQAPCTVKVMWLSVITGKYLHNRAGLLGAPQYAEFRNLHKHSDLT